MASSVFYKFKSQKDESRVTFDGTGISLFDLKKEIIIANNLAKANDFDLAIFDRSSNEEYKDDSIIIPRASSVIVKRVFVRQGKGKAAMYLNGSGSSTPNAIDQGSSRSAPGSSGSYSWHRGNMSKRFDGKDESASSTPKSTQPITNPNVTQDDEAKAMAAMFQASAANWEETQEKMSHQTPIYNSSRGGAPGRGRGAAPHRQPDRPLPPSYVCYRCGQKGHWIQDCPTNNDREFDNRPRIKRTTGIPRSFLKAVDSPSTGPITQGVMVTPEGGYVVAQPDLASWQKQVKQVTRQKRLTEADIRERKPTEASLTCPIDHKLFKDAVKTPCCGTVYCEECVQTHLLERDFICPNCGVKIQSLDKLIPEKEMRGKVGDYIEKEIEKGGSITVPVEGVKAGEENGQANVVGASNSENKQSDNPEESNPSDDAFFTDQQPGANADIAALQMAAESIPAIQAQINQVAVMLNNPTLPIHVRQQTEMKHAQLQMELQQAQMASALIQAGNAAAMSAMNMNNMGNMNGMNGMNMPVPGPAGMFGVDGGMGVGVGMMGGGPTQIPGPQGQWGTNPFSNQQPAGQDSAYQRLPLNNRRRNLKRERPSDFLEVAGDEGHDPKVPRYWE